MISVLFLVLASPWILWIFFVAVMRLKQVRAAGQLSVAMKVFGYPAMAIGLLFDLFVQYTLAWAIFAERPQEYTVSGRLWRLSKTGTGWRQRWAIRIRVALLDAIDPSGVHHG